MDKSKFKVGDKVKLKKIRKLHYCKCYLCQDYLSKNKTVTITGTHKVYYSFGDKSRTEYIILHPTLPYVQHFFHSYDLVSATDLDIKCRKSNGMEVKC
jgi:hypothetical protein